MSKGYVYIMTTAVDGIIKIGRSDNWTRRCQDQLEANGYKNMNGLKTYFVAKVDNQEEIEAIMHDIFRESRVSNFEMFAVDKDRAKRVLSKMGEQVYPEEYNINTNKNTTDLNIQYKNFWTKFENALNTLNIPLTSDKNSNISDRSYYVGNRFNLKNGWRIGIFIRRADNKICISANTSNINKFDILNQYLKYKKEIETELGYHLLWNHVFPKCDPSKTKHISYYIDMDLNTVTQEEINNIVKTTFNMYNVFLKYS